MSSISVAEMLKILGKWTRAKDFEEFVSVKREISTRHAHNLIKKAVKNGEIMRALLQNGAVIYGLAEFGPQAAENHIDDQNQGRYAYPNIDFQITQRGYDLENRRYFPPNQKRPFPSVGFNLFNLNDYPIGVRVEVRMILGGKNLGLIPDPRGHYNGKTEMKFDRNYIFANGNFTVPEECAKSDEELTLEVKVIVIDPSNGEHKLVPRSFTYMRNENDWFYEPRGFT